jgi:hypothetical protein
MCRSEQDGQGWRQRHDGPAAGRTKTLCRLRPLCHGATRPRPTRRQQLPCPHPSRQRWRAGCWSTSPGGPHGPCQPPWTTVAPGQRVAVEPFLIGHDLRLPDGAGHQDGSPTTGDPPARGGIPLGVRRAHSGFDGRTAGAEGSDFLCRGFRPLQGCLGLQGRALLLLPVLLRPSWLPWPWPAALLAWPTPRHRLSVSRRSSKSRRRSTTSVRSGDSGARLK